MDNINLMMISPYLKWKNSWRITLEEAQHSNVHGFVYKMPLPINWLRVMYRVCFEQIEYADYSLCIKKFQLVGNILLNVSTKVGLLVLDKYRINAFVHR